MANLYVRSTDGSDADNGSTWALAKATLAGAAAIDAAGDVIYVSQAHAESTASAVNMTFAGTVASPVKVIAGSDAAEPPTSVSTAPTITTTTSGSITLTLATNGILKVYGLQFICGSGQSANLSLNTNGGTGSRTILRDCALRLSTTGAGAFIAAGSANNGGSVWANTTVRFSSTGQSLQANGFATYLFWVGGEIESGSSAITTLFNSLGGGNKIVVSGVDLSRGASSMNISSATAAGVDLTIRNCKLPASWTGSLHNGTPGNGSVFRLHNCDSGDTNYRFIEQTTYGSTRNENTIVRTGGATDGTTALSWKMVTTADAEYPESTLDSPELPARWNSTVGSSITVTVEIITDNVTLTDGECWLEVQYLGTAGFPESLFANDAKASYLATAANQTTSTETWTTTGLTTPVKQKLSVTITPQEVGYIQGVVRLAKASTTVYVDPLFVVT